MAALPDQKENVTLRSLSVSEPSQSPGLVVAVSGHMAMIMVNFAILLLKPQYMYLGHAGQHPCMHIWAHANEQPSNGLD